jgi:tRNA 2-thiouridine synthesizing protein A
MQATQTLDVRGLSCPEPALLTRQTLLELGRGALEVLADSSTARNNIERTAKLVGWTAAVSEEPGCYRITLTK